jgi:hypothetical protein
VVALLPLQKLLPLPLLLKLRASLYIVLAED